MLHFLPFECIQSLLKQQIKLLDLEETRKAYYTVASIDDIFASDITQKILSFNESKDINSVFGPISKSFTQYAQNNEEIYIKQLANIENISTIKWDKNIELKHLRISKEMNEIAHRIIKLKNENPGSNIYEMWDLHSALRQFEKALNKIRKIVSEYRMTRSQLNKNNKMILLEKETSVPKDFGINFDLKYDKSTNNIWIIDKNRNDLSSQELKLFCNGPFDNFETVMNEIKSGDKIYIFNDFDIGNAINKDVQIIGVSDNELINCNIDGTDFVIGNKSKVFLENIKFNISSRTRIKLLHESGLWVNNSIFEFEANAISCINRHEHNIAITDCDFYGSNDSVHIRNAIEVRATGTLNVMDCMFVNCTCPYDDYYDEEAVIYFGAEINGKIEIKCSRNKFVDNIKYPFGSVWRVNEEEMHIELKNNYLIGYNGIEVDKEVNDANRCYPIVQIL